MHVRAPLVLLVFAAFSLAMACVDEGSPRNNGSGAAGSIGSSGVAGAAAGAPGTAGSMPSAGVGGPGGGDNTAGVGAAAGTSGGSAPDAGAAATVGLPDAAIPDVAPASDTAPGSDAGSTADVAATNACAALFCDDFDSYAAPGAPGGRWKTTLVAGGTLSVDTTHAHSGKNAVHVMNPGAAATERALMGVEGAPLFPLPHNTFFGRMMIYVTKVPGNTVHWTIIQGEGATVPGYPTFTRAVYRYGGQINGNRLMANYDTNPSGMSDCAQRSQVAVPMHRWACVEWRFDGEAKELDFWLDGTIIPALSVRQKAVPAQGACQNPNWSGVWEPPIFDAIRLGWQHYQQGPGEAWIDDVAIDTKRVGCPTAP